MEEILLQLYENEELESLGNLFPSSLIIETKRRNAVDFFSLF